MKFWYDVLLLSVQVSVSGIILLSVALSINLTSEENVGGGADRNVLFPSPHMSSK